MGELPWQEEPLAPLALMFPSQVKAKSLSSSLTALPSPATMTALRVMRYVFFSWRVRLILGILLLNAVATIHSASALLAYPSPPSSVAIVSPINETNILFQGTSSVSRELSLQCARQSKRVLSLICPFDLHSSAGEKAFQLQASTTRVCSPAPFSVPLKISPPSAEDEPFLN